MRITNQAAAFLLAAALCGCGGEPPAAEKADGKKTAPVAMDVPQPAEVRKSEAESAPPPAVPALQPSAMQFAVAADMVKRRQAEQPIADKGACLRAVEAMEKKKNAAQIPGGLWAQMEQNGMKEYSARGSQLDGKISRLVDGLRYLCQTAAGAPFSKMADFIIKNLQQKGDAAFRAELENAGKAAEDIEIYLRYAELAKDANQRVLDWPSLHASVLWGEMFVDSYHEFYAQRFQAKSKLDTAAADLLALEAALDRFTAGDRNMVIAYTETLQQPAGEFLSEG